MMPPGYIPPGYRPPPRWGSKGRGASRPFKGFLGLCVAIIFSAAVILVVVVLVLHASH